MKNRRNQRIQNDNIARDYNENIGKNYINANTVTINEVATEKRKPIFPKTNKPSITFVLSATFSSEDEVEFNGKKIKIEAILKHLEKFCEFELTVLGVEKGSVKLKLGGSKKDLEKLKALFESGELNKILDIPIEKTLFGEKDSRAPLTWLLLREIQSIAVILLLKSYSEDINKTDSINNIANDNLVRERLRNMSSKNRNWRSKILNNKNSRKEYERSIKENNGGISS